MRITGRRFLTAASLACGLFALAQPGRALIAIYLSAEVDSTITSLGGGQYLFSYDLLNNRGCTSVGCGIAPFNSLETPLTDFYLPYFPDANIISITDPAGWTDTIVASDLFMLGNGAEALDWSGNLAPLASVSGFSYIADFSPVKGPAQENFLDGTIETIDPAVPGSPDAINAGLTQALPLSTPEPGSALMVPLGLILAAIAAALSRYRRVSLTR